MTWTTILQQETGQCFCVTAGVVGFAWSKGAPFNVLCLLTILGGLFIVFEKIRVTVRPDPKE